MGTKAGVKKRVMKQNSLGKTITVKGKKYDKEMILAARRATRGAKNVLVSMNDAKQIFEAARPGTSNTYDAIERGPWHTFARATSSLQRLMLFCALWWPRLQENRPSAPRP